MGIHYNDNYRAAYQQLQKTLDHLSKVREAAGTELPGYDAEVLNTVEQSSAEQSLVEQSLLEQARADQCDIPKISKNSVGAVEWAERTAVNDVTVTSDLQGAEVSDSNADEAAREMADRFRSVWVSVGDEQWHVKEILPSAESYQNLAKEAYDNPAATLEHFMGKTALLLHGEFGSGRCYYDGKGSGLAWAMAEQGYHVFVVDSAGRKFNTGINDEDSKLQKIKKAFSAKPNSLIVREHLPHVISACGKRAVLNLKERLLEQSLVEGHGLSVDEEKRNQACMLFDEAVCTQTPGVWIGHGFGAAMLAAAWTRMPENKTLASQMVFFEGHRYWRGGNWLSKGLARVLSSRVSRGIARAVGKFPAGMFSLGGTDEPAEAFDIYSRWIGEQDWLDPEDGFDYQLALIEKTIPSVLHIMNESENCLVPGSAVRRFSNELAPRCADLIGIPSSLEAIAAQVEDAMPGLIDQNTSDQEIPRFSYTGMLLHPDAKVWLFNPLMKWLSASNNVDELALESKLVNDVDVKNSQSKGPHGSSQQLDLQHFLPSSA